MTTRIDLRAHRALIASQLPLGTLASLEVQEDQAVARAAVAFRDADCAPAEAEEYRAGFRDALWAGRLDAAVPKALQGHWCAISAALVASGSPAPAEGDPAWTDLGGWRLSQRIRLCGLPGPAEIYLRVRRASAGAWRTLAGATVEGHALHVRVRPEFECQ